MAQIKKLSLAVASLCLFGASAAHAVDIQAGDWKLGIGGNVNGFITSDSCEKNAKSVTFGLACAGESTIGIQNGLLPNEISFTASSRQDDLDVSATISLWPTIDTTAAGETGTGRGTQGTGLNSRQGFFTFGDKSWGTVKIGRDLGIFGSDAILSDMTLLSVGAGSGGGGTYGGPTTLGRIGAGYLYADWLPQVTYSTPNFNGFSASGGVFQGLSNLSTSSYLSTKQPGFQGKLAYDFSASGVGGKVWGGFLTQKFDATATSPAAFTANAYEVGIKAAVADFEAVAYYYDADGVGTTLLFLGANDAAGNKRKSSGGYVQGTYKIGKVKLGLSYGESKLEKSSAEAAGTALLDKNDAGIASIYYSLTKSITLVAEYINTESKAQNGDKNKQETLALGGIIFF
jgi:predicted porin